MNSSWTMEEALTLIRELEPKMSAAGWHVALGGGVLLRGQSEHDLDLVFFPHVAGTANLRALQDVLTSMGWTRFRTVAAVHRHWRSIGSTDTKHVEIWECPKRVDVIVPMCGQELLP